MMCRVCPYACILIYYKLAVVLHMAIPWTRGFAEMYTTFCAWASAKELKPGKQYHNTTTKATQEKSFSLIFAKLSLQML